MYTGNTLTLTMVYKIENAAVLYEITMCMVMKIIA